MKSKGSNGRMLESIQHTISCISYVKLISKTSTVLERCSIYYIHLRQRSSCSTLEWIRMPISLRPALMTQHMRMCSALDQGQKDKLGEQGVN